jgi:hypothetical protein
MGDIAHRNGKTLHRNTSSFSITKARRKATETGREIAGIRFNFDLTKAPCGFVDGVA